MSDRIVGNQKRSNSRLNLRLLFFLADGILDMVSMVQVVFQLAVADVVVIMPIIFVTDEPMPVIKLVSMVVTLIPMAPNPA